MFAYEHCNYHTKCYIVYTSITRSCCARQKTCMNYLEAKTVLLKDSPQIPFKLLAVEVAAMIAIAGILVRLFA